MKTFALVSLAVAAFAVPACADGPTAARPDVAASTYIAERPDSSATGNRQTAKRVLILRDPDLRAASPAPGRADRSLAAGPEGR